MTYAHLWKHVLEVGEVSFISSLPRETISLSSSFSDSRVSEACLYTTPSTDQMIMPSFIKNI